MNFLIFIKPLNFCGKLSKLRERGLAAVSVGEKKKVSVLENEVNTAGVPLNKNGK